MSITNCIKKLGKAINKSDADSITAIADSLIQDGMTPAEINAVENQALNQYLSSIDSELDDIAERAEGEGATIAKEEVIEGESISEANEFRQAVDKGLDMSTKARLQRAEEMGFDTGTTLFHGSDIEFNKFDTTKRGTNFGDSASAVGFFFSDSKEGASQFGDDVNSFYIKSSRNHKITDDEISDQIENWLNELDKNNPEEAEYQRSTKAYANTGDINKGFELAIVEASDRGFDTASYFDEDTGETWTIVFGDPSKIRSVDAAFDPDFKESPQLLAQKDIEEAKEVIRGTIQLFDESVVIKLHQASDLSSFLHESAHLFLEMEGRMAAETEITKDQQVILDWLGVKTFEDIKTEEHEKFAETFEVYVREGKAPSLALRDAFAAFKRWLTRIYQSLTDPRLARADLTQEITEVFDRLLATEAEIEQAMANPAYDQFFKSKEQSGMSDAEWEVYLKRVEKARNRSQETLDEKLMKELYARKTKEWKEEKEPLIEEEIERLSKEPVYAILNETTEFPMDRKVIKEIMGFKKIPKELYGKTIKDGVDPQEYVELYGYSYVEEMIHEMISAPTLKQAAEEAAEARMIEKYGDILNDGSIEAEAREAVHNDAQAELVL